MRKPKPSKILIVDDDEILREFYVRVFANFGYETVCAADGGKAISIMQAAPDEFDLVILDMLVRVKSGWEVLQIMRDDQTLRDKPVIAITSISAEDAEVARLNELCDDVILKGDFEMTRLSESVGHLLGADLIK